MAQGRSHINTYRDREYFRKELSGNEISQGIKQIGSSLVNNFNEAVTITQKANESTLASNQVDLSAKFLAENNKINTKYQADPANPQREVEARQAFDLLASQYKVNPLCEKQWNDIKTNVYDKYKTYNAQWVEQQQQTNIQTNLKNGYENLINQISMLGESGASVDQMKLIYANGIEGLKNGATAGLGEVVVENFLKDADHDIMTTYISALALNNPIAANELIQREDVRNDIGRAETLEKLESYIGTSLNNQAKRTAVNELCSALRAMNSQEAEDLYTGKADLAKAMKFIENNKQLPKGSVDAINELYGIKTKSGDWYYDSETKSYKKQEKKAKGGVKGMDAIDAATAIELKLIDLFSFNDEDMQEVNPKKTVKKGEFAFKRNCIAALYVDGRD